MKNTASISDLFAALTNNMSDAEVKTAIVTADISAKITEERVKLKMSQKAFAGFMGVSQAMVSKWESGDYNFTISAISKIFDKLDLDFEFTIKKESRDTKNSTIKFGSFSQEDKLISETFDFHKQNSNTLISICA